MTRPLRNLHRRIFQLLQLAVPCILLVSLLGYRGPVEGELPELLRANLPESAVLQRAEEDVYDERQIGVELFAVPPQPDGTPARRWVRITMHEALRQPDIIVYWSTRASAYDRPPLGAQMVGIFDERGENSFPLPTQATFLGGRLVFYSVGQGVLIAQVPLPSPG